MNKSLSIRLKGLFLLLVFSLNTVVGFACAVGLDMGFNSGHHPEVNNKNTPGHTHSHKDSDAHHEHKHTTNHEHQKDGIDDHHNSSKDKDNCCSDETTKLAKADKLMPHPVDFTFHLLFFTALLSTFFYLDFSPISSHTPNNKLFVRCHHPPIPDIRVAIQSFQI